MADGQCCVNFVRILVILFNAIFALCALALLGVAVWLLVDNDIKNDIKNIRDIPIPVDYASLDLLRVAAIMFIVFGALLFLISLFGVIGAIMEHRIILGVYMACLIVIFVGEIIGGVLAILFKDMLLDGLDEALRKSLKKYYNDYNGTACHVSETGMNWDAAQKTLECCGVESHGTRGFDAHCFQSHPPESCNCSTPQCKLWPKACQEMVEEKVVRYAPILIGLGIGVAMIQTIGIIFATCLCVNAPASQGYKHHRN